MRGMGFFDRGAFSFLREEHLEGSPLFVHSKARKKMVGLAAAYRRQLQYEEQQLKTHLTKMNEIEFSKKYTVDGVEFFHSKAEMDKFYHAIELEKLEKERRSSVIGVKSKFMKAKAGFNFFAMAKAEPPARKHNEVVEELITNATNYNKKDEWELPTRPHIAKGHMKSEYAVEKKAEDAYLNQLKVNMWEGDLLERFAAADAFHSGHVAESDLRRIILRELEGERVHDPEKKLEMILHKGELEDDACHLDHEVLIKESIKVSPGAPPVTTCTRGSSSIPLCLTLRVSDSLPCRLCSKRSTTTSAGSSFGARRSGSRRRPRRARSSTTGSLTRRRRRRSDGKSCAGTRPSTAPASRRKPSTADGACCANTIGTCTRLCTPRPTTRR